MKKTAILVTGFILLIAVASYAQPTVDQILRQEELLQQEKELREKVEEATKIYIKDIIIKGATLLSEEEIESIISSFKGRWLTKDEITQIIDLIKKAYEQKVSIKTLSDISYKVIDEVLEIQVPQ